MKVQRIVVIGGGVAGVSATETLRDRGFDGTLTLVSDERHLPYNKPPLSKQFLRGEVGADEIHLRSPEWYADRQVDLVLGDAAVEVATGTGRVLLRSGTELPYDRVLIATGGMARKLPLANDDLGVHVLRSLDDAVAVRAGLRDGAARVVVVGAGFIGAEVAASARSLGCEVTVLELSPHPLSRVLGPAVGGYYARLHASHGVRMRFGVGVREITSESSVKRVTATDGSIHEADVVVVGIGINVQDDLGREAGLAVDGGIVVNAYGETSASGVFAAGDVTRHPSLPTDELVRVEQWQNAQHQAQAAAASLMGEDHPHREVPWFWSDQYDVKLQMAGRPDDHCAVIVRGDLEDRDFSVFYLDGNRVRAVVGVNRARDVRTGRRLIAERLPVDARAIADEGTDLSSLLPGRSSAARAQPAPATP